LTPGLLFSALGVGVVAIAAVWQHLRYLRIRRERVEDRQPLFHSRATFHEVTLLEVASAKGRDGQLGALRALRDAIEAPGGRRS